MSRLKFILVQKGDVVHSKNYIEFIEKIVNNVVDQSRTALGFVN